MHVCLYASLKPPRSSGTKTSPDCRETITTLSSCKRRCDDEGSDGDLAEMKQSCSDFVRGSDQDVTMVTSWYYYDNEQESSGGYN